MNKVIGLLFCLCFAGNIFAQYTSGDFTGNYGSKKYRIDAGASAGIASNAITGKLMYRFLFPSILDSITRASGSRKLKDENNIAGGDLDYQAIFVKQPDSSSLGYYAGFANHEHTDVRFTGSLFNHYFFGNKPFRGDTANLAPFSLNTLEYQQLKFGIIKSINNENGAKFRIGGGIALVNGQESRQITVNRGKLFTAEDGTAVFIDLAAEIQQTDQKNKGFGSFNGFGASTDLFFSAQFKNASELNFSIRDFGFIGWNSKAMSISVDSSFNFEGLHIEDIFDFDNESFSEFNEDSLSSEIFPDTSFASYTAILPAYINLDYQFAITENKFYIQAGMINRLFANYNPYFFVRGKYHPGDKSMIALTTGYGGYGRLNIGLEVAKDFGKGLIANAGTYHAGGLLVPDSFYGLSAYVGMGVIF